MKKLILLLGMMASVSPVNAQPKSEFDKMSFIIGSWRYDAKSLMPDGSFQDKTFYSKAEYIFGGNALKDDFSFVNANGDKIVYGSTIRSYDAQASEWKMLWYNYNLSFVTEMTGSYENGEFHFNGEGSDEQGAYLERITFYDIAEDSYSWKSDKSYDKGKTWLKNFFSYMAVRIDDK